MNEDALKWLSEQPSKQFVLLKNANSRFDAVVELKLLPARTFREGKTGRYTYFDPSDFDEAPPFPPLDPQDTPL